MVTSDGPSWEDDGPESISEWIQIATAATRHQHHQRHGAKRWAYISPLMSTSKMQEMHQLWLLCMNGAWRCSASMPPGVTPIMAIGGAVPLTVMRNHQRSRLSTIAPVHTCDHGLITCGTFVLVSHQLMHDNSADNSTDYSTDSGGRFWHQCSKRSWGMTATEFCMTVR